MDTLSLLLIRPKISIQSDVFHCHAPGEKATPIPSNDQLSSHAALMASCGLWSYTFHHHASIGFRSGEYGGRNSTVILSCAVNQSLKMLVRWKQLRQFLNAVVTSAVHSYTDMYSSRCFNLLNKYNFSSLSPVSNCCQSQIELWMHHNVHFYWLYHCPVIFFLSFFLSFFLLFCINYFLLLSFFIVIFFLSLLLLFLFIYCSINYEKTFE